MTPSTQRQPNVLLLYNQVGHDEYESMKHVDPATLGFTPSYPIHVATVRDEIGAIVSALQNEGYSVRNVNVEDDLRALQRELQKRPDVVFNLVESFHDRAGLEGSVAGLYDLFQVPYTGAGPFALGLCNRKGLAKQVLLAHGIPTPRFRVLQKPSIPRRHGLHYPLMVKPAREDASAGVTSDSVVHDYASLVGQLEKLFAEFAPPILVEEFIEGKELHVSILGNDPPRVLPIIEFDFSELPPDAPRIISYDAKWNPLREEYHRIHTVCPAKLHPRIVRRVQDIAVRAFQITGCRDYARLDLRLDRKNRVSVLEINPNPDLTEGVSFMESAEKAGMTFGKTLATIVEFAYARRLPLTPSSVGPAAVNPT
jgi:D-alanine-D-alanine ligase